MLVGSRTVPKKPFLDGGIDEVVTQEEVFQSDGKNLVEGLPYTRGKGYRSEVFGVSVVPSLYINFIIPIHHCCGADCE